MWLFVPLWCGLTCVPIIQENTKLKNDMIAMEGAVAERLGYLQRYKVSSGHCKVHLRSLSLYMKVRWCTWHQLTHVGYHAT